MKPAYCFNESHVLHTASGHPEHSGRLTAVMSLLERHDMLQSLTRVPCDPVDEEALRLVHSEQHIRRIASLSHAGGGLHDGDTYATKDSFEVALQAVGGLLRVTEAVLAGKASNGFALIRPPGHHALPGRPMGFCLFSNVAIAARWAQHDCGVDRIAIVDFDVHHGNGTQDVFYADENVLFISTHQFPFYPGTGSLGEIGDGPGTGMTMNVPLPAGTGDQELIRIFTELLAPAVARFRPELILVSAGFDAHYRDPLGGLKLTVPGFVQLLEEILDWAGTFCDGRLVCSLEGGYDLDALAHCVLHCLSRLSGSSSEVEDPFPRPSSREAPLTGLMDSFTRLHKLDKP